MSDAPDVVTLREFIERLKIADIRCMSMSGHMAGSTEDISRISISIGDPVTFLCEGTYFGCRYPSEILLQAEGGDLIGELRMEHVIDHELDEGAEVSEDTLSLYAQANGLFIAFPYIREAVDQQMSRLRMGRMLLGILNRGETAPIKKVVEVVDGGAE